MAFTNRPTSRRKIANLILALNRQLDRLFAPSGAGTTFYVDSATGVDDQAHGRTIAAPFATWAYAIAQCTHDKNDVIKFLPGHSENIASAAAVAMNVRGVTAISLGQGSKRATFTHTTGTDATITVSAANCRISNCYFDMSLTALVSGIVVSAASFEFDNNEVLTATAGGSNVGVTNAILTTAAADRLYIHDNYFHGPSATPGGSIAAGTGCVNIVGGHGAKIVRNYMQIWGTTTAGAINNATTAMHAYQISDNIIINNTASATKGVVLHASSVGMGSNNRFGIGSGAAPITSAAGHWAGNWSAAAVATNGTLV